MELTALVTERTTAATDGLLALVAWLGAGYLQWTTPRSYTRGIWQAALVMFGLAAALGAVAHGFALAVGLRAALWQPLYLLLGGAVALFVVGSVGHWRGPAAARHVLPAMLLVVGVFYLATRLAGGNFLVFVIFEAGALLFALGVYTRLAAVGRPGASRIALALGISLVAGGLQALEGVSATLIWEFDHNGLYHLVQLVGLIVLLLGLRPALRLHALSAA